jgi:hypothetical protein
MYETAKQSSQVIRLVDIGFDEVLGHIYCPAWDRLRSRVGLMKKPTLGAANCNILAATRELIPGVYGFAID